jgi:hypothetical protein
MQLAWEMGFDVRETRQLAGLAAIIAVVAFAYFGTLSPCGILRETARQRDGLAAVLPDSVVDLVLVGQYGALSPGRCIGILLDNLVSKSIPNNTQVSRPQTIPSVEPPANPQPAPVTVQNPLEWAMQVTAKAAEECRAKRLRGELPTRAASIQCANAPMLTAFNEVHYRYMDLIQLFASKRVEVATRIDRGEMTEQQGQLEIEKAYTSVQETERQRDRGAR